MALQPGFEFFLKEVEAELRPICRELRSIVADLDPDFVELIWPKQRIASYGVGPKKMSEHYVYVAPQTRHVNLGLYHGASVGDPTALLEGAGKRLRHVKIRSLAEATAAPLRRLITEAIAERREALG
jgi:hypothetical protein